MAIVHSQPGRMIAGIKWYLTSNRRKRAEGREYVSISAGNGAMVSTFFDQMGGNHERWGKNDNIPAFQRKASGGYVRDENGELIPRFDKSGRRLYESAHVQYYSLVQGFSKDELDPDDPEAWERAQELGRALAQELARSTASKRLDGTPIEGVSEDAANGHMFLVVTEIGSNGHLHNHIVLDAVNQETGASLNSAWVTHHRLAVMHDRVLAEQGYEQRKDLLALSEEVNARQVAGETGWSYRTVADDTRGVKSSAEEAQDLRHIAWQQDAAIAAHQQLPLPTEPFSVAELQRRADLALADPRATSWDELQRVAQEHHLTIEQRGKTLTFGMMRQQPDGTWADPAKSDRRRGTRLGEAYTRESVEATLERHEQQRLAALQAQQAPVPATAPAPDPLPEPQPRRSSRSGAPAPETPKMERYESKMRKLMPNPGPEQEKMQRRLDAMIALDEEYAERFARGERPDAEFERRAKDLRITQKTLDASVFRFHPVVREQLEHRQRALDAAYRELQGASRGGLGVRAHLGQRDRINAKIEQGDYEAAVRIRTLSATERMYQAAERAEELGRDQERDGLSL